MSRSADSAATHAQAAEAERIIRGGSRSFAAAARLFDPQTRISAHLLYAWCRHCDDQIDGQELGHGQEVLSDDERRARLDRLFDQTRAALAGRQVTDPVFSAFAGVVRQHAIPPELPIALIDGFALDVAGGTYADLDATLAYCWHVAGVVGVMMAMVMGARREDVLDRACDLGLALQLTNIARDVIDDARLGRVYLPLDALARHGVPVLRADGSALPAMTVAARVADPAHRPAVWDATMDLLDAAEPYYASATAGLAHLPFRSALAVAAARGIYRQIGRTLRQGGPRAWDRRVVVGTPARAGRLAEAIWIAGRAASIDRARVAPPRTGLWTRPRPA